MSDAGGNQKRKETKTRKMPAGKGRAAGMCPTPGVIPRKRGRNVTEKQQQHVSEEGATSFSSSSPLLVSGEKEEEYRHVVTEAAIVEEFYLPLGGQVTYDTMLFGSLDDGDVLTASFVMEDVSLDQVFTSDESGSEEDVCAT